MTSYVFSNLIQLWPQAPFSSQQIDSKEQSTWTLDIHLKVNHTIKVFTM